MSPDASTPHMAHGKLIGRGILFVGFSALLVLAACGGGASETSNNGSAGGRRPVASAVSGTISVGTAPSAVAVDSNHDKIYVADFGAPETASATQSCSATGADVTVINGSTGSTAAISLEQGIVNPIAIALNPSSGAVYVVEREWGPVGDSVRNCYNRLDGVELLGSGYIHQWIEYGTPAPAGIHVNQVNGSIYLVYSNTPPGRGIVTVLNGSGGPILVGTKPAGVAVNTGTDKIYVANSGSNNISVIDGAANSVIATITDPNAVAPVAIAVNATTNTIYVANSQSNNVTVIDGATDTVTGTIAVGTSPSGVDVDAKTNFIYVANAGNSQAGVPGNLTVINGATNATQTLTDPNAKSPAAVAVNSVTNKIYVANSGSNNVTVIDGANE